MPLTHQTNQIAQSAALLLQQFQGKQRVVIGWNIIEPMVPVLNVAFSIPLAPFFVNSTIKSVTSFSTVSTLPNGITLSAAGILAGTPSVTALLTTGGSYSVAIRANMSDGSHVDSSAFSIKVQGVPLTMPTSYWSLDAATIVGTAVSDLIGGVTGTRVNAPTAIAGNVGEAQQFANGGSAQNINLGTNALIIPDQVDYSLAFSYKGVDRFVGIRKLSSGTAPNYDGYEIYAPYDQTVDFLIGDATGGLTEVRSPVNAALNDGNWHQTSVSHDRDAFLKLYSEGLLVDSQIGTIRPGHIKGLGASATMGYDSDYGAGFTSGALDEFAFWKGYALTADEAATLCWLQKAGVSIGTWLGL